MFNPNGTFKWSVDLATDIYSNPKANATWEYIYPQICKYMEDRGKTITVEEKEDRRIISVGNLDIIVMSVLKTIGISFMALTPFAKTILDEAYDNKMLFGLPVSSITWDDFMNNTTIIFMSRDSWEELNSPQARELERIFNQIDRLFGL